MLMKLTPGISCNVIAAFHHDHIFVPYDKADEAIICLRRSQEKEAI
jgi:hypothetical protein